MMLRVTSEPENGELIRLMKENPIGRNAELCYLMRLLDANEGGLSVFLNGTWGCGKSYFVRQAALLLQCLNPSLNDPDGLTVDDCEKLFGDEGYCRDSCRTYLPVYFNAWKHDAFGEPVLSLMCDIADMEDIAPKERWDKDSVNKLLKDIGKSTLRLVPVFGDYAKEIVDSVDVLSKLRTTMPDPLQEYQDRKKLEDHVRGLVREARENAGGVYGPVDAIVIFIDELDRCRPTYAIEVLESVKHLLVREDVIVFFSVDMAQLIEAIKGVYGLGYDAERYLRRFRDLQLRLPEVDAESFARNVLGKERDPREHYDMVARELADSAELTMRDYQQLYDMYDRANPGGDAGSLWLDMLVFNVLTPLTCYLQVTNPVTLDRIIRTGEIDATVLDYADNINIIRNIIARSLASSQGIWSNGLINTASTPTACRDFFRDLLLVYLSNPNVRDRDDALSRLRDDGEPLEDRRKALRRVQELWASQG